MNSTADSAPAPSHPLLRAVASLVLGVAAGVFLHYLIYRLSLPVEPFIYVSF
jgi:hypothetical protein